VIKESLENTSGFKVGEDFGLAYASFHKSSAQDTPISDVDKVQVAANDKYSLNSAALIFEVTTKHGVKKISGIKTAELTALFAAAKRDSNVALANELAVFCESASVDYVEVLKLMENSMQEAFLPTISEEDNRNEAYILLENAENLNAKLRLPLLARQVNEDMARHAVNLTQDALRCSGKPLRRAKVALFGSSLAPESASLAFVESLEAKGAKVSRYDPYSSESPDAEETLSSKKTLNEAAEGTDCVVILSEQEQLRRLNLKKLRALMKSPAAFVDLASMFEPAKVEDAGFTYRGLGRGVWKK
jgi:UDP-N-acetyl-D-mannosaminuronic acid dehydrogenase